MRTEGVIHMRAFVFPGQGSQKVGMGVELAEASALRARKIDAVEMQGDRIFARAGREGGADAANGNVGVAGNRVELEARNRPLKLFKTANLAILDHARVERVNYCRNILEILGPLLSCHNNFV